MTRGEKKENRQPFLILSGERKRKRGRDNYVGSKWPAALAQAGKTLERRKEGNERALFWLFLFVGKRGKGEEEEEEKRERESDHNQPEIHHQDENQPRKKERKKGKSLLQRRPAKREKRRGRFRVKGDLIAQPHSERVCRW